MGQKTLKKSFEQVNMGMAKFKSALIKATDELLRLTPILEKLTKLLERKGGSDGCEGDG